MEANHAQLLTDVLRELGGERAEMRVRTAVAAPEQTLGRRRHREGGDEDVGSSPARLDPPSGTTQGDCHGVVE